MKHTLTVTVAAAAALLAVSATGSGAADLEPPPPTSYPSGLYLSVFGGGNWLDDTSFSIGAPTVSNDYDTGFVFGGALGYDFGSLYGPVGVRLEGELSYRENDIDTHSVGGAGLAGSSGDTSAFAGMVNVLLDFDTGTSFTPYVGGGIGAANVDFDDHSTTATGIVMNDNDTRFAYQFIAGVGWEFSPSWVLDVQYRYFGVDNVKLTTTAAGGGVTSKIDYESHAVTGGLRWNF